MTRTRVAQALTLGAVAAVLAACGTGSEGTSSSETDSEGGPTTITWWHNSNTDPGKAYYDEVAQAFEDDHPGTTVEVSAMQHEDMLTKLDAAFQGGDAPDVYMERGGGELADHVEAGLVQGHLRGRRGRDRDHRRLGRRLAGGRQDVRAAVLRRRGRVLVQQGALRAGRDHRAARDAGRPRARPPRR